MDTRMKRSAPHGAGRRDFTGLAAENEFIKGAFMLLTP